MEGLGLSPYEVLVLDTRNAGEFIDAKLTKSDWVPNGFGTVEVGKRADLLLLRQNPLR